MITLRLEVPHFDDARHWHWRLLDSDNQLVLYNEISLDLPAEDVMAPRKGTATWMRGFVAAIIAGERDSSPLDGLDPIDTAIAARTRETLTARAQPIPSVDAQWQPITADVVAAAGGERKVSAELDRLLGQLADTSDWATLVSVLRRILVGERDPDQLGLDALDAIDSAIVKQVLTGLAGEHSGPRSMEGPWDGQVIARTADEMCSYLGMSDGSRKP